VVKIRNMRINLEANEIPSWSHSLSWAKENPFGEKEIENPFEEMGIETQISWVASDSSWEIENLFEEKEIV
jgi:hypothetical protein